MEDSHDLDTPATLEDPAASDADDADDDLRSVFELARLDRERAWLRVSREQDPVRARRELARALRLDGYTEGLRIALLTMLRPPPANDGDDDSDDDDHDEAQS